VKRTISRTLAKLITPFTRTTKGDVRILCYHGVNKVSTYLNVSPALFREHLGVLAELGYTTTSLVEFLSGNGCAAAGNKIIITFDDGYRDNYEQAYPIMAEYGFTGTIFCTTGSIGTDTYLTAAQIMEMYRNGWEFGSHTVTHPHLPRSTTKDKQRELGESKKALENILGVHVTSFCYPYGEYDAESISLLEQTGYRMACSNRPGSNRQEHVDNPYLLRRTEIGGFDSLEDFRLKLHGGFDLLHQTLHAVRGRP
jgi:peptidoglycan/xylan/chitin deacetylase (PgdA/CDA1 family)